MNSIALILPAYNEELTIAQVIQAFYEEIPEAHIYVIDNNSIDRTAALASKALSDLGAKGGVIFESRQGKGNAVRRAFLEINADVYVMADADLTYPASRVRELIAPILAGDADMVVGDRHSLGGYQKENKRSFHSFGNALVTTLVNKLFRANLVDIMSGYRVFSRRFVKNYAILVEGFEIETDMTLHSLDKRYRIREVPIEYIDRPAGSVSKLNTFSDGAKVLFTIFQILCYYRPLFFFGIISVFFGVLGLIAAIPVFDDWITYRYIYHVPLAILAVALEIVAALSLSVSLVLNSITRQYRMQCERDLLNSNE
jgi:glycosyltransferase involved in cell wall biosynthesis